MAKVKIIIELRHSQVVAEIATSGMAVPLSPTAVSETVPKLPGVQLDLAFAPVAIPAAEFPSLTAMAPLSAADLEEMGRPAYASYIVRGEVDEEEVENLFSAVQADAQVVGVYADATIEVCPICPADPPRGTAADVERLLCVERLRRARMDGRGVLVAIVDTGINMRYLNAHGKSPALDVGRSWRPASALPVNPGEWPVSHGTMCAFDACIAAPRCTLLDIALLRSGRPGGSIMEGRLSDGVLAYRHLLNVMLAPRRPGEFRSLVVNNSWGMFHPTWDFPVGHPGNYSDNPNHPFNRIASTLERAGADILFAAGNCGRDCPDRRCLGVTNNTIYGANGHPQVLSVAGVDVTGTRVGYSAIGPGRLSRQKPDICGFTHFQGSGVYPADGGTSAATPVVAGVVAAVRSRCPYNPGMPSSHPVAIRRLVCRTALDRGAIGYDFEYGYGIINGCRLSASVPLASAEATYEDLLAAMVASAGIPPSQELSEEMEEEGASAKEDAPGSSGCACSD